MSLSTHRHNVRSMRFENLEDRRLMAGSVDIHLDGANLEVIGTADRDKLSVFYDDSGQTIHVKAYEYVGGYWVESQHREFDADDIAFIRIRGAGDDDVIYNSTEKDSEIFGGAGNDWISGGGLQNFGLSLSLSLYIYIYTYIHGPNLNGLHYYL